MRVFVDESIHDTLGIMILAWIVTERDPNSDLNDVLNQVLGEEFHSAQKMQGNERMQLLRREFRHYLNLNCRWGVMITKREKRYNLLDDLRCLIDSICSNGLGHLEFLSFDKEILVGDQLEELQQIYEPVQIRVVDSRQEIGVQLADLVAALCGVCLRERLSGNAKILTYGKDAGFNPPISAELGYELWASLRCSMLNSEKPLGDEMPQMATFNTEGIGLLISQDCTPEIAETSRELFGHVYLGCIH